MEFSGHIWCSKSQYHKGFENLFASRAWSVSGRILKFSIHPFSEGFLQGVFLRVRIPVFLRTWRKVCTPIVELWLEDSTLEFFLFINKDDDGILNFSFLTFTVSKLTLEVYAKSLNPFTTSDITQKWFSTSKRSMKWSVTSDSSCCPLMGDQKQACCLRKSSGSHGELGTSNLTDIVVNVNTTSLRNRTFVKLNFTSGKKIPYSIFPANTGCKFSNSGINKS